MSFTQKELGQILGHARRDAQLTQRQAAEEFGVSVKTIEAHEQGKDLGCATDYMNTLERYGKVVRVVAARAIYDAIVGRDRG